MPRIAVLAVLAIASVARADGSDEALRDVLAEAPLIVRGWAIETVRSSAYVDMQFGVTDRLRGELDADAIVVRAPIGNDELLGDDVILLLDAKTADGVYPLHQPAGRFRIVGDTVIVNASGIDGTAVSAKDLRPRAPDEAIPLEQFRALAGGSAAAKTEASLAVMPRPVPHAPLDAHRPPRAPDEPAARWPWIVAALVACAVIVGVIRRVRAS